MKGFSVPSGHGFFSLASAIRCLWFGEFLGEQFIYLLPTLHVRENVCQCPSFCVDFKVSWTLLVQMQEDMMMSAFGQMSSTPHVVHSLRTLI